MNNPAPGEPPEKSYLCRVWGRLTDWEKSPVYRTIISMRIRSLFKRMESDGGALAALARIGKPAVPALIWALENGDAHTRKSASGKLGKIGDVSAVPALSVALGDGDEEVRWVAAQALGKIGDASAVPALIVALGDKTRTGGVRWYAAEALGKIRDVSAVPALVEALGDEMGAVREWAAGALMDIGRPALPALIVSLGNKDGGVRWYATRALEKLEPESRDDIKLLRIAARKARAEGNHTGGFTKVYRKWSGIMNERAREGTGVKRIRVPSKPGTPRGTRRMLSMDRVSG